MNIIITVIMSKTLLKSIIFIGNKNVLVNFYIKILSESIKKSLQNIKLLDQNILL